MTQTLFVLAVVAAGLACPTIMWLGRRGIGPGCALCPPRDTESLEELRTRQQTLARQIDELEARSQTPTPATRDDR